VGKSSRAPTTEQAEIERSKRAALLEAQLLSDLRLLLSEPHFMRVFEALKIEFGLMSNEAHENPYKQYWRDGQKSVGVWLMNKMVEAQTPPEPEPKAAADEENSDGD
jgi:hypothetical protein